MMNPKNLTDDEYNFAAVLLFVLDLPFTERAKETVKRNFTAALSDPAAAFSQFTAFRNLFENEIARERKELKKAGKSEATADDLPPALSVLYSFKPHSVLHVPSLGDLKKIDLQKLANEPGEGFSKFLSDLNPHLL